MTASGRPYSRGAMLSGTVGSAECAELINGAREE